MTSKIASILRPVLVDRVPFLSCLLISSESWPLGMLLLKEQREWKFFQPSPQKRAGLSSLWLNILKRSLKNISNHYHKGFTKALYLMKVVYFHINLVRIYHWFEYCLFLLNSCNSLPPKPYPQNCTDWLQDLVNPLLQLMKYIADLKGQRVRFSKCFVSL